MGRAHYTVAPKDRGDVARALIAAADDHEHEVRTSDSGFYVDEALWARAFPPADQEPPTEPGEPDSEPGSEPEEPQVKPAVRQPPRRRN